MRRQLVWLRNTRSNVQAFPAGARKSKKGIATPKHEVDLIKQRYKEAKELAAHDKDEE